MILLKIPGNRIAQFKRNNGDLLKQTEERGTVKLKLSDDGTMSITGDGGNEWITEQVLVALTLGFKPPHAFKLFGDDYFLEKIDLDQACRGSEKQVARAKSRIIGTQGKAMQKIQELTGAYLAVDSDNVAILGKFTELKLAKEAVFRLLEGAEHRGVYAYLEKAQQKNKQIDDR